MLNIAIIDCRRLEDNIAAIKKKLPAECKIAATIKGDAYGHGLVGTATALERIDSVSMFVVASFDEAFSIIEEGLKKPILVLNDIPIPLLRKDLYTYTDIAKDILDQTVFSVYSFSDFVLLDELGESLGHKINVHLRLDPETGIKGLTKSDFERILYKLSGADFVNVTGAYGHLYSMYIDNEEVVQKDLKMFDELISRIPQNLRRKMTIHLYSSSLFNHHLQNIYDMVRIGVLMYGYNESFGMTPSPDMPNVHTILTIKGQVLKTSSVISGQPLDYSGWTNTRIKKVALISLGNWDIPFFLNCRSPVVGINGHICNVVGSPCMDSCLCDISDYDDIKESDEVTVLSDTEGLRFDDWIKRSDLGYGNCQMLLSGTERLKKYYLYSSEEETK